LPYTHTEKKLVEQGIKTVRGHPVLHLQLHSITSNSVSPEVRSVRGLPFPTTNPVHVHVHAQARKPTYPVYVPPHKRLTGFAHGLTCPLPDRLHSFSMFISYCLSLFTFQHLFHYSLTPFYLLWHHFRIYDSLHYLYSHPSRDPHLFLFSARCVVCSIRCVMLLILDPLLV
jgi:hypothetical protein